jgi:hypothetical protein
MSRPVVEFSVTNNGIHLKSARFHIVAATLDRHLYALPLLGHFDSEIKEDYMLLQKIGPGCFARLSSQAFQPCWGTGGEEEVREDAYIAIMATRSLPRQVSALSHSQILVTCDLPKTPIIGRGFPEECWDAAGQRFITRGENQFEGYVEVSQRYLDQMIGSRMMSAGKWDFFYISCGPGWVTLYSAEEWANREADGKKKSCHANFDVDNDGHSDRHSLNCGDDLVEATMTGFLVPDIGNHYAISIKTMPRKQFPNKKTASLAIRDGSRKGGGGGNKKT